MIKRRDVLIGLAATCVVLGLPGITLAQAGFSSTSLGGNLWLISGAGSNVVIAEGTDSVVVVNGGLKENADALLAEINRITNNKPISALFNTNWRPENCGLNYLLGPQGVAIIAHENTRLWQGADFYVEWQDRMHEPMPADTRANTTIYKTGTLNLGTEVIEYGFLGQSNTDGDIYVHFTQANVLVVGDMVGGEGYPTLDYVTGGWIGGAQKATAGLIARANADTKVLASHGTVLVLEHLQAQAAMLEVAYNKVAEAFKTGRSLAQFKEADPMMEFNPRWGDPQLFLTQLYNGTWYHVPGRAVPGII
jgi:glyoxylase-like metal-dependent hydrolase (beta-lactamase superfamily II)